MGESYDALPTLIVIAAAAGFFLLGRWIVRRRHGADPPRSFISHRGR